MTRTEETKQEPIGSRRSRGRPAGDTLSFPRHSLKIALSIPEAIESNNAGKPYNRIDLATAVGVSPESSGFRKMLTSCNRYGLTVGGQKAEKIELTQLASCIVSPTDKSDTSSCLRSALTFPELFKKVYDHFDNNKIPREQVFKNTLRNEFGVAPEDVSECYKILMENANDYGIVLTTKAGDYLRLDKLGQEKPEVIEDQEVPFEVDARPETEDIVEKEPTKQIPKQIFIAHGKNMIPLTQLKDILTQFQVPFQVAVDEAHAGRAISKKVADLMRNCSSGIFIFTADEETTDSNGNSVWRPSDNVVFELGAGTILYEDRIVIFREEGVEFGSDFTAYGRISFAKDKLKEKGLDLMKELIAMKFLEVKPAG